MIEKILNIGRWRCPDENQLAGYVDGLVSPAQKNSLESHLARCQSCRGQIAFLTESADWQQPDPLPAHLAVRARKIGLVIDRTVLLGWRWTTAMAAAACLFLVLSLGLIVTFWLSRENSDQQLAQQQTPVATVENLQPVSSPIPTSRKTETGPPIKPSQSSSKNAVRNADPASALSPRLLSPREGSRIDNSELIVRWSPATDVTYYEVSIVSAAGDPVYQARTEASELRLPADARLSSGAKYFVWVTANLKQGKTSKSNVTSFRVK